MQAREVAACLLVAAYYGWPSLAVYIIGLLFGASCGQFNEGCFLVTAPVFLLWLASIYLVYTHSDAHFKLK